MKRANLDADDPTRKMRRDAAACERQIAWLTWLLGTKLGKYHRTMVEKELHEHHKTLADCRSKLTR
jgi:hypothetical protein